jgi:hypothetical protein
MLAIQALRPKLIDYALSPTNPHSLRGSFVGIYDPGGMASTSKSSSEDEHAGEGPSLDNNMFGKKM